MLYEAAIPRFFARIGVNESFPHVCASALGFRGILLLAEVFDRNTLRMVTFLIDVTIYVSGGTGSIVGIRKIGANTVLSFR